MEISEKQKVIADQKGELDFHKSKIADLQHRRHAAIARHPPRQRKRVAATSTRGMALCSVA